MKTDEDLWRSAAHGDHNAFGVIFDRHAQRIYNHCFRRVADWSTAEDLASVVFLEAWRCRDRIHFVDNSVLPWLLGVATNVCHNGQRSLRRYSAALSRLPDAHHVSVDIRLESDEIVDRLESEAQARAVLVQLAQLNKDDRALIEMSVWDGLAYEEIAVALDIPVGTVRSRLSRARARLRAKTNLTMQLEEVQ